MSEHTKEPWAGKEIPLTAVGLARAGFGIVFTNHPATRDEAEANARRIVASVNACAGIPTDVLEAAPQPPKSEPIAYIEHHKGGDNLVWDNPGGKYSVLYTAPPVMKLSDERILELVTGCAPDLIIDPVLFARAIERELLGE